jgi:hypothetical protein
MTTLDKTQKEELIVSNNFLFVTGKIYKGITVVFVQQ